MARTVFSAGKARSGTMCAAVLLQVLLLSSVGARTAVRPSMSSAARKLSQEDDHTEASFVELLGSEPPLDHLYELFIDSGSTMDSVSWLVDVTRDGCSAGAVEEDPHAGHDHRRKLMEAEEEEHDHAEDEEHDHAEEDEEEEEHDHAEEENHDDHDHDDHGTASVLNSESLVAATANLIDERARLETAMSYIMACQADASCTLEEEHEDEEDEGDQDKLWALKMGLALAFLAITIVASYVPVLFKGLEHYSGILSLFNVATGAIFLTVGIVHLLPEVVEFQALADLDTDFPLGFAMVVIGFCMVLFTEHVVFAHEHSHACKDDHFLEEVEVGEARAFTAKSIWKDIVGKYRAPMIMQLAVLVHATLESVAVGLASPRRDVLLLFAAIAAHKPFDSMAIATRLYKRGCPAWLVQVLLLPIYIVPFLGVVIGTAISSEDYTTVLILNALTVGGFIYVGGFEVLCEEFTHEAHVRAELDKVRRELEQTKVDAEDVPALSRTPDKQNLDWQPSKPLKFLAFVVGVGLIFLFTAVLPGHVH